MSDHVTLRTQAAAELAANMTPDPADLLDGVSINAQLIYANQVLYHVFTYLAASTIDENGELLEDDGGLADLVSRFGYACEASDHTLILAGLLPPQGPEGM